MRKSLISDLFSTLLQGNFTIPQSLSQQCGLLIKGDVGEKWWHVILSLIYRHSEEEAECEADTGGDLQPPLAGGQNCLAAGGV